MPSPGSQPAQPATQASATGSQPARPATQAPFTGPQSAEPASQAPPRGAEPPVPAPPARSGRELPDLMNMSHWRAVWIMGAPGVARSLLASAVQITNLIIVGRLGPDAIAAAGVGNRVMFVIISVLGAITVGTTALVARAIGQRDPKRARDIIHQSMLLSLLIGAALALIGIMFSGTISRALLITEPHVDPVLQRETTDYMFWNLVPMLIGGLSFTGAAIYQGAGDMATPLWVLSASDVLNVGVGYALVYGVGPLPAMGVGGAGLATGLSRALSAVVFIWLLLRRTDVIRWLPEGWRLVRETVRDIMMIGLPAGGENLLRQGSFIAFTMVTAALGSDALAAANIVQSLQSIVFQIGFGFGIAATALVGMNMGAGARRRAFQCAWASNWLALAVSTAAAAALFFFPHAFGHLYTNNPTVDHLTAIGLTIMAIGLVGNSISLVLAGALRGGGDATTVMYITAGGTWTIRLAGSFVLGIVLHLGMAGVFAAMSADMWVRALVTMWRFHSGAWVAVFERQEASRRRALRVAEAAM